MGLMFILMLLHLLISVGDEFYLLTHNSPSSHRCHVLSDAKGTESPMIPKTPLTIDTTDAFEPVPPLPVNVVELVAPPDGEAVDDAEAETF